VTSRAARVRAESNHIVVRERDGVIQFLCSFDPEQPDCWEWSRNKFHALVLPEYRACWYAVVVGGEARNHWREWT